MIPRAPPGTLPHPTLVRGGGLPAPHPGAPPPHLQQAEPPAPGGPPNRANGRVEQIQKAPAHVPLAKCRALYIGSSVPKQTSVGIDAVQQPLQDRYQTDGDGATNVPGIDAWLTVFSSGMLLQYTGDKSMVTWFPIYTLHVSAAVKCVPYMQARMPLEACNFMSLDSPPAKASRHPPIFAMITRRTTGRKVLECHGFICKSEKAALACVQATTHAYEHKEGWAEDEPPRELYQELEANINTSDPEAEADLPLFQPSGEAFEDKPPAKGYFQNYRADLVKNFNVLNPSERGRGKPNLSSVVPAPVREPHPRPLPLLPGPGGLYGSTASNPYMLPARGPPPAEYFDDWGAFQDVPVMVFPGPFMPDDQYKRTVREIRGKRRPRTYGRPAGYHSLPPRRPDYATYRRGPPSDYMDDFGNRYYSGDNDYGYSYRDELPRRGYLGPDPDMMIYAPRYVQHIGGGEDEYTRSIPRPGDDILDPYRLNEGFLPPGAGGYGSLTRDLGYYP